MIHKHRIFTAAVFCMALLLSDASSFASGEPVNKTDSIPMWQSSSQPPLDPALKKTFDSLVLPMVTSGRHVGIVVGIIDGDKRWVLSYGRKALGRDIPPNGDTVYEIGSVTKTFTSAALAIMGSRGVLSLKDPVSKFLPKSVRMPSYKGEKVTLENLSAHTSGLPRMPDNFRDSSTSPLADPYAAYTARDMYEFLARCRLTCAPGKKCEYSNIGAGLLGLALTRAGKTTYESIVNALLCKPLGLKDTGIKLSKDQRARLAPGYTLKAKGQGFSIVPAGNWTFQDCFAGAGALRSTANDMLIYLAANMGLTQTPLKAVLQSMQKMRYKEDANTGVGLAWQILTLSEKEPNIIWHNGGTGGYCSFVGFCRERGVGVVILSNTSSFEDNEEDEDITGVKLLLVLMNP